MELLRIDELLKEKGVTSKDLALRLEVTQATVSNIKNGNHFPKPELLKKIADELDVDIKDLFYSTKEGAGEPLYIERDGKYISVGEIRLSSADES